MNYEALSRKYRQGSVADSTGELVIVAALEPATRHARAQVALFLRNFRVSLPAPCDSGTMKGHDIDNLWFFGIVVAVAIPLIPVSVHYAKKGAPELTELAQQIAFQFLGSKLNTPLPGPALF